MQDVGFELMAEGLLSSGDACDGPSSVEPHTPRHRWRQPHAQPHTKSWHTRAKQRGYTSTLWTDSFKAIANTPIPHVVTLYVNCGTMLVVPPEHRSVVKVEATIMSALR
jgi:hypothetical protein